MERETCYIDNALCSGARFSFCDNCKKAKAENAKVIEQAQTPAEITLAHILDKTEK